MFLCLISTRQQKRYGDITRNMLPYSSIIPRRCRSWLRGQLVRYIFVITLVLCCIFFLWEWRILDGREQPADPNNKMTATFWDTSRGSALGLNKLNMNFRSFYEELDLAIGSLTEEKFTEQFLKRIHRSRELSSQPFRFVQIGASRGFEWNDPITAVKNSSISYGLMIEPVPHNAHALRTRLAQVGLSNRIHTIAAACGCPVVVQKDFFMVSEQYSYEFPSASIWNKYQVGSFNRDHVLAHLCRPGAVAYNSTYWRYSDKQCSGEAALRQAICFECNEVDILKQCDVDPACGGVSFIPYTFLGITITHIRYGSVACMTSNKYIVKWTGAEGHHEGGGEIGPTLFVKRDATLDRRCRSYEFVTNVSVECLPGHVALDKWREFATELATPPLATGLPSDNSHSRQVYVDSGSDARKAELDWKGSGSGLGLDVLIVDVEGWDLAVLQTLHLERLQDPANIQTAVFPWVIIYESQHLNEEKKIAARELLESHNYIVFELLFRSAEESVRNTVGVARVLPQPLQT